jgi:phenylalanyl-tRNA synthetase alpha chain
MSSPLSQEVLTALVSETCAEIASAVTLEAFDAIAGSLKAKQSPLAQARAALGKIDDEAERKELGRLVGEATAAIMSALDERKVVIEAAARREALEADRLDLSEVIVRDVRVPVRRGHAHVVAQTQASLEEVFIAMGFSVAEGPEVETDWYNFEALNLPPGHPARDTFDTMYLDLGEPETVLLRTHTSPTQIHLLEAAHQRGMHSIHAVMPGRCYRLDTPDARHLPVFHQIEGLVVDRDVTFGDLAGTIETFTAAYFGPDIHSRLRPAYFPFTEPSAEFEITCTICRGEGCRTCSRTGWIELGGCGMVDPAVFEAVGIDPSEWSGFAFGFGIDRCAQMRHGIADMRALIENDLRFVRQF